MFMAIAMFGEPGAEIMYPDPGFPIYRSLIEWTGAEPVPIALHESRGFAFSAEEVLAQITPRTRLIIVNSPANPTGGVVPKAELDRLVAGLARIPRGRRHVGRDLRPHVLRRRAARLAHRLPGDRGPADPARRLVQDLRHDRLAAGLGGLARRRWPSIATRLAINIHSCVNAATQWAGIAALTGPQDAVDAHGRDLRPSGAAIIVDALNGIPGFRCVTPGRRLLRLPQHRGHRPKLARSCRTSC